VQTRTKKPHKRETAAKFKLNNQLLLANKNKIKGFSIVCPVTPCVLSKTFFDFHPPSQYHTLPQNTFFGNFLKLFQWPPLGVRPTKNFREAPATPLDGRKRREKGFHPFPPRGFRFELLKGNTVTQTLRQSSVCAGAACPRQPLQRRRTRWVHQ